jgi:inner membrane protein
VPAIGHLAVGIVSARIGKRPKKIPRFVWIVGLVALAYLPDLDVIAFKLGIPYHATWGHRGAAHSLGVALILGALLAIVGRLSGWFPASVGLLGSLVMASHGVLDTLTDGGLGIAVFWPFSNERYFAPWTPIPVAPIGLGMFSTNGLDVIGRELVVFSPLFIFAALWPRRRGLRVVHTPSRERSP